MDGWTWELLIDDAHKPATATILRKLAERFSNGSLATYLWSYPVSALMYLFHKKLPEKRIPRKPSLRPVTVGLS